MQKDQQAQCHMILWISQLSRTRKKGGKALTIHWQVYSAQECWTQYLCMSADRQDDDLLKWFQVKGQLPSQTLCMVYKSDQVEIQALFGIAGLPSAQNLDKLDLHNSILQNSKFKMIWLVVITS